ncbi:MAG: divergent PAP2 family protein [Erysipelotrichaceae bacterium]|nr:divergent PAP2 family protein [Erysipelotrichaceae bacterium]
MLDKMYPFYAAALAIVLAQVLKPVIHWLITREWKNDLFLAAGSMPSSHVSGVSSLCLAVGILDGFRSTLFAVTLTFSIIIAFDAANVRYYAGQNIQLTKKLIDDLTELGQLKPTDPIYQKKMKEVLGHTYFEVLGGIITGLSTSYLYYLFFVRR